MIFKLSQRLQHSGMSELFENEEITELEETLEDVSEAEMSADDESKEKDYESIIEGILFTMGESVSLESIASALEIQKKDAKQIIEALQEKYENEERGIRIVELDGAYQMCTNPDIYEYLIKIAKQPRKLALTEVMMETLSIIAYKQPVTRVEIEAIRGVSCDHAVNKLVEYDLVKELGRSNAPGRPILFGTTEEFLRVFGVSSIEELPSLSPVQVEEFKQEAEAEAQAQNEVKVTI